MLETITFIGKVITPGVHAPGIFLGDRMKTIVIVPLLFLLGIGTSNAQETVSPHGVTFTLDPTRTAPGTVEIEIGTLSGNSFDMPWIFKFTADSKNWFFRDIEWAFVGGVLIDSSESTSVSFGESLTYRVKPNFEIELGVR